MSEQKHTILKLLLTNSLDFRGVNNENIYIFIQDLKIY